MERTTMLCWAAGMSSNGVIAKGAMFRIGQASSAAAVRSTVGAGAGAGAFVVVVSVITGRAIGDVIVLIDSTAIDSVGAAAVVVGEKNYLLL